MNKIGQVTSIIIFFVLMAGILMASIIILRLSNSIIAPFQAQIGNNSIVAGNAVAGVSHVFDKWWDILIVSIMFINLLLLFISAFMIDIHPAFVLVYIIAVFFMFIMGNYFLQALDGVWNGFSTSLEISQTPMQQFIVNNFSYIMLGVVVLSGVIMYAKFRFWGGQGAGGNA